MKAFLTQAAWVLCEVLTMVIIILSICGGMYIADYFSPEKKSQTVHGEYNGYIRAETAHDTFADLEATRFDIYRNDKRPDSVAYVFAGDDNAELDSIGATLDGSLTGSYGEPVYAEVDTAPRERLGDLLDIAEHTHGLSWETDTDRIILFRAWYGDWTSGEWGVNCRPVLVVAVFRNSPSAT